MAISTSRAKALGASLSQILGKGQWSKEPTWKNLVIRKYYIAATTFQSVVAF